MTHIMRGSSFDMIVFIFKLGAAPLLIGGVSLAGRRWGPAVSGWLVGLPLTSAPVLLFLALEHGATAAVQGTQGVLMGGIAVTAFCLAYSRAAEHWPWWGALTAALAAYLLAAAVLGRLVVPIPAACALVAAALALALWLLPPLGPRPVAVIPPRWDLPLRMALATGIILVLTSVVPLFGAHIVGLLSSFPAMVTILGTFAQRQQGPAAAAAIMRGVVLGLFGFAAFYLIIGLAILHWGIGLAFLAATGATLAVQGASLRLAHRASESARPQVQSGKS
jgi:hypothetical protein